jgi:glycosyltransferase involved in cell wall biosynthesis
MAALRAYLLTPNAVSRADIVHVHLGADASLIRKLPIVWFAAKMKKPVILHFHVASTESLFVRTSSWALSALRSRAALVIALSSSWKTEFEQRWPEIPTSILPNPVSCSANGATKKHGTILFLGKLETRKGYTLLLEALPAILREFPTAQLWMAGHGGIEKGRVLARKLGVDSSVRFLGWVSGSEKQRVLEEAEILCLPSFAEGVPMAVLEGMAHALPVVATPVGGIPDVIANGRNGVLIPVGHSAAISDAITALLRDPQERRRLGECAQETVRNLCSLERVAAMLSSLYLKIWRESEKASGNSSASAHAPRQNDAVA